MADLIGGVLSEVGVGGNIGQSSTAAPTSDLPSSTSAPSVVSTTSTYPSGHTTSQASSVATKSFQAATTTSSTSISSSTSGATSSSSSGSSTGAIAAGVIAIIAIIGISVAALRWYLKRRQKRMLRPLGEAKCFSHSVQQPDVAMGAISEERHTSRMPYSPNAIDGLGKRKSEATAVVYELSDTSMRIEMDSGQRYHAYRPRH